MPDDREFPMPNVSPNVARRLLERATELDTTRAAAVRIADLRASALEAGIAADAFDLALAELDVTPQPDARAPIAVPAWVRLCMFGVPTRDAAMVYYWTFAIALIAGPSYQMYRAHGHLAHVLPWVLTVVFVCLFALWSTSLAIRWMDDRGLDYLPSRGGTGA